MLASAEVAPLRPRQEENRRGRKARSLVASSRSHARSQEVSKGRSVVIRPAEQLWCSYSGHRRTTMVATAEETDLQKLLMDARATEQADQSAE